MPYAPSAVQGGQWKWKNTTGGITTYTKIPGVLSAKESAEDADTIDVTPIDSGSEVTLTGFAKPGSMSMELAGDLADTVHLALQACAVGTGTAKTGDLQWLGSDTHTRTWTTASVSKFEVDTSAKSAFKINVTFKLSGSPVNA